jgi:methylated-DNA-[protein]-cysteine S-methyltransferase
MACARSGSSASVIRRRPTRAGSARPRRSRSRAQLEEYFAGTRQHFELPLHPVGTPFQLEVWHELGRIPYGVTISYGELARRIDKPLAVRAVGAANGRNPLPIVLPCHRVIGANGSLTGFGGGLPTKRYLLTMEDRIVHGDLFG